MDFHREWRLTREASRGLLPCDLDKETCDLRTLVAGTFLMDRNSNYSGKRTNIYTKPSWSVTCAKIGEELCWEIKVYSSLWVNCANRFNLDIVKKVEIVSPLPFPFKCVVFTGAETFDEIRNFPACAVLHFEPQLVFTTFSEEDKNKAVRVLEELNSPICLCITGYVLTGSMRALIMTPGKEWLGKDWRLLNGRCCHKRGQK